MKYYKLEKIVKGENPIIRITFKNWLGRLIVRDVCKCATVNNFWVFMDNGDLTFDFETITTFNNNDLDVYYVNGQNDPSTPHHPSPIR